MIASDCKSVIEDILNVKGGMHGNIIKEIKSMAAEFDSVSFNHEDRASNVEVGCLAKHTSLD